MSGLYDDSNGPARSAATLTPSDGTAALSHRAIWVGTGGDITLRGLDDSSDVVLKNIPSGSFLPVRASLVKATGTTATDLVALR